jgi:tetratricopeptide (TPR) repeat protein
MLIATFGLVLWSLTSKAQAPATTDRVEQLRIADSQCRLKQFQEAENTYKRLLAVFPDFTEALTGFGRCYLTMGRAADAARVFSEVVRRQGEDQQANRDLAHALVDLNQFSPAEHLLKKLLAADDRDKESWYYLGVLMYQNGYFGSADSDLEKSIDPASTDAARTTKLSIYRAVCWVHLGRTKEAEALMTTLAKDPIAQKDPDLLLVFAELLYETNRPGMALQRIDQAILARPDLAMGYFWRGKVLYRLGRLQEAATAEEKALHVIPELPYPRSLLVKIYQAQGRTDKAAEQAEWLRAYEERRNLRTQH